MGAAEVRGYANGTVRMEAHGDSYSTLHLYKGAGGGSLFTAETRANSLVGVHLKKASSTTAQEWHIVDGATVNGVLEVFDATRSEVRLAVQPNGDVGIGTSDVSNAGGFSRAVELRGETPAGVGASGGGPGTGGPALYLGNTVNKDARIGFFGADLSITNPHGRTTLYTGAAPTARITVTAEGNVGVGTTTPTEPLSVAGAIEVDGHSAHTVQFTTFFGSGTTHTLATLTGPFDSSTVAVATLEYTSLYSYAGDSRAVGIKIASTRRKSYNTAWANNNNNAAASAGTEAYQPYFEWSEGALRLTTPTHVQVTGVVRITAHAATVTRVHASV